LAGVERDWIVCANFRNKSYASIIAFAGEAIRTAAVRAMVPTLTVCALSTCSWAADTFAFLCGTLVVVRALKVTDALRLATVDGVTVRNVAVNAAAPGDAGVAHFTSGVGSTRTVAAWISSGTDV